MVSDQDRTALLKSIRTVPDFPKKGIMFRDVTTLFKDPKSFSLALQILVDHYSGLKIDKVVGIESRGFILGAALAERLGAGFVPIRKKGKLPGTTIQQSYELEYGTDTIEIHSDALQPGERILLHDDLLATGGTMSAAIDLCKRTGAEVAGICFLIELTFLHGRQRLSAENVFSIVDYDTE